MTAREKLSRFIADEELTQDQFADIARIPAPQISLWLSGKRRPGLMNAFKLERATRGIVRATEWSAELERRRVA